LIDSHAASTTRSRTRSPAALAVIEPLRIWRLEWCNEHND
jgi:hypothetical protein